MDLSHLNASQRRAVDATEGPVLVLAGAGSGKTRVITHRIVHLLELGIPAERIVALSFTNKAAGEMRERLTRMVGAQSASELVLATFHSLGAQMLRADPTGFGLGSSRFTIVDQGDVLGIVRSLLREYGHHGSGTDRRFDVPAVSQRISLWKNAFVEPDSVQSEVVDEYDVAAASIYAAYEDRLRTLGAVDFDDLVCLVAARLAAAPELRTLWQSRFDYLMVDEYQDTNDAQFAMLMGIVDGRRNLCVVGDDDQAIYGWRGAKVENILEFENRFAGTTVVKLQENYRSRAAILACANAVVVNNTARHDKALLATRAGGHPVTVVVAGDTAHEASWVGKEIRKMVLERGVPPAEVAVLYRSAIQARLIEEELQQHGIPYRVLGGQAMYDKKEVKDALAYLKTIVTPRDELAVRRAMETPPRGIGRKSMDRLANYAQDHRVSLLEAVHRADTIDGLPSRTQEALRRFSGLIREAQAAARASGDASAAVRHVLSHVEFRDHVRKETGSDAATDARMAGVDWLMGSVGRFETRKREAGSNPRWSDYFGVMSLDGQGPAPEVAGDLQGKVTLATLHSAKGLEWNHVFIIGVEEGTMPHRRVATPRASDAIAGDLEEERRLFYVGMTRARERLWLTRALVKRDRGRETPRTPSRFLDELPREGVELYDIASEEELSSAAIGDMAAAFLSQIRPPE